MSYFLKYFAISLGAQIVLLLFILLTGVADFLMYLCYMLPYLFVGMVVQLPNQIGGDSILSLFLLLCLPAIVYSALFGGIMLLIQRKKSGRAP